MTAVRDVRVRKSATDSSQIHILFLDHAPIIGGAQLALAEHLRQLDRKQFRASVACSDAVPALVQRYRDAGASIHVLDFPRLRVLHPRSLRRLVVTARHIKALARSLSADVVVANTARTAYASAIALALSGLPLVWWVRDFFYNRLIFAALRRLTTRVVCVSEALRHYYGGFESNRFDVVVVGSSLHTEVAAVDERLRRDTRTLLNLTEADVVVGFMARLVEEKGAEDLLLAVSELHARHPHLRLLIVGEGRGQVGDVEGRLRGLVEQHGWTFVRFAGYQSNQALFYGVFDVFVHASRGLEAYPTSVVQAMMAGVPVIATNTGGTSELVTDEDTGLLVSPSSPKQLASAIGRLVGDERLRNRLITNASQAVMKNNREEHVTRRMEEVYRSIARRGGAATASSGQPIANAQNRAH